MLFDTPGISLAAVPVASTSAHDSSKKRKRPSEAGPTKDEAANGAAVNLDKLMKRMKKMDKDQGWGGQLGGGGKTGAEGTGQQDKQKKKQKGKKGKSEAGGQQQGAGSGQGGAAPSPAKPHRFEPAKKDKRAAKLKKQEAKATFNPASSANMVAPLVDRSAAFASSSAEPSSSVTAKATRHAAPNFDEEDVAGAAPANQPKQTSMQASLRAKLAGGKFRMLNETLYTSTGEQAWETMKEEGAFDDVGLVPLCLTPNTR